MVESDMNTTTQETEAQRRARHELNKPLTQAFRLMTRCAYCHKPIIDPEYHEHGHCTDNN